MRLRQQEDDLEGIEAELAGHYQQLRAAAAELSNSGSASPTVWPRKRRSSSPISAWRRRLEAVLETKPLGDDAVRGEVPAWGADQLELTLAANPGEPALPLRKVASGGELSARCWP